MIRTIFHLSWLNLRRDRVALVLTFVLPLAFFSIFASVFGAMDQEGVRAVSTALAVLDEHPVAIRLAEMLRRQPGLEIHEVGDPLSPAAARGLVESGVVSVAVVIPSGFGAALIAGARGEAADEKAAIEILTDRSNPVASGLVTGLLQTSALRLGLEAGAAAGPLVGGWPPPATDTVDRNPLELRVVDVLGGEQKRPSVAFFASGLGVLFLLFAVSGRSAILIEERETGVLERMLAARATLTQLLLGRWLFLVVLGSLQVTVMFVWASAAFGLELWTVRHLAGFAVITPAAAAAAAAFGLVLSSACRSRAQLNGVSTVVILTLSAVGGSLFPSFLMPEGLQRLGRLTFNAWALDGYQQVFWYEAGVGELWPQVLVLVAFCFAFLVVARLLASAGRALEL